MIIDFHTHAFPEAISQKALQKLSFVSGGLKYYTDGTLSSLRSAAKREGADISVMLSIATNAHQMKSVNDFAAEADKNSDIIAFGSVYPWAEDAEEELERIKDMGLRGVKFHPEYQNFFVDDEKMKPIYKKISKLGLITIFHAGLDYGYDVPFHCMPENMRRAAVWFDAPVVAAHWGGLGCGEGVLEKLCGIENLYFDTAFGYGQMPRCTALRIVEKHGTDKLLFGTDAPWSTPQRELRLINTLGLSESEREDILCANAAKILHI